MIRLLVVTISLLAVVAQPASATVTGRFGNGDIDRAEATAASEVEDAKVNLDVDVSKPGSDGAEGSVGQAAGELSEAPEGVWIAVSGMVFDDPPCVRTTSEFLEGVAQAEADMIRRALENQFVAEYEAYISSGNEPPPPCPSPDGSPGLDPTEAVAYADDASTILPTATPSISGGYAITGLRSWLDLGRPSQFTDTRELDLGPFTRTATFTATATATVDWGDGTITTHTGPGGPYHSGQPGPDDIVHTYTDTAASNTLTVTDTWDITVSVPGLEDITLTYTTDPPATMTFPIREVRSTRDR